MAAEIQSNVISRISQHVFVCRDRRSADAALRRSIRTYLLTYAAYGFPPRCNDATVSFWLSFCHTMTDKSHPPPPHSGASTGTHDEGQAPFDALAFMTNFDPTLVHRVLLTDSNEYPSLTMSGQPRLDVTPAFDAKFLYENGFKDSRPSSTREDGNEDEPDMSVQISRTMKRAFHDALVASLRQAAAQPEEDEGHEEEQDTQAPARNAADLSALIIELHEKMTQMIPNRTDLHGILSDEELGRIELSGSDSVVSAYIPHLIASAEALIQLESEDRSITTRQWLEVASNVVQQWPSTSALPPDIASPEVFVVSSLSYLHLKADLCASDIADYHLSTVLAPQIALHGPEYERFVFQQRFGPFDEEGTAPVTRQWIERVIQECGVSLEELRSSEERRVTALQTSGWVNLILFQTRGEISKEEEEANANGDRSGGATAEEEPDEQQAEPEPEPEKESESQPFIHVPEILQFDVANLRSIRSTTRMSVIGSALALHACTVAGVGDAVLRRDPSTAEINQCRDDLIEAMSGREVSSQQAFEEDIASAVIALAKVLKPNLTIEEEQVLKSRTPKVMQGTDPVLKLLDNRMRGVFCELMEWSPEHSQTIPVHMSTGTGRRMVASQQTLSSSGSETNQTSISNLFLAEAKRRFRSKGFAFYAAELSEISLKAVKVINLAFVVYGKELLEPIMMDSLYEQ